MTAGHVSDKCLEAMEKYEAKGKDVERAIFFTQRDEQGKMHFYSATIDARVYRTYNSRKPEGFAMSDNIDIAVFRVEPKIEIPFLGIREPSSLELYEDVAMCGYPSGMQSLNWSTSYIGARFSPLVQFGKIVNFLPTDDSPIANGIQTDIIGTGGSSGSAIVDIQGNVVGIALEVMKAGVLEGNSPTRYATNVGLVYGLAPNLLKPIASSLDIFFEQGKIDVEVPFDTTLVSKFSFQRF